MGLGGGEKRLGRDFEANWEYKDAWGMRIAGAFQFGNVVGAET